ncbi:hypothetical protein ABKV19_007346, partial [Rosa sericea]
DNWWRNVREGKPRSKSIWLMDLRYEMQRATSFVAQAMAPWSNNTAKAKAIALRM